MKKTKATVADIAYITQNTSMSVQELSKATDLTLSAVRKVLEDIPTIDEEKKPSHIAPTRKEPTQLSKMFGRSKLSDGTKGAALIMTPGASQLSDDLKQKGKPQNMSHIHKPLG